MGDLPSTESKIFGLYLKRFPTVIKVLIYFRVNPGKRRPSKFTTIKLNVSFVGFKEV